MTVERPRILVVEDDPDIMAIFSANFVGAGYRVIEATTGPEILSGIEQQPDVTVTDLGVPGTARGALDILGSHPELAGFGVLVVTASAEEVDLIPPVMQVLRKPCDPGYLVKVADELLANRSEPRISVFQRL